MNLIMLLVYLLIFLVTALVVTGGASVSAVMASQVILRGPLRKQARLAATCSGVPLWVYLMIAETDRYLRLLNAAEHYLGALPGYLLVHSTIGVIASLFVVLIFGFAERIKQG